MENSHETEQPQTEQQEQPEQGEQPEKQPREERRAQHDFLRFKHEAKQAREALEQALGHPLVVFPGVRGLPDHGSRVRWDLGAKGKRVGLLHPVAGVMRTDVVLVQVAGAEPANEALPDARALTRT